MRYLTTNRKETQSGRLYGRHTLTAINHDPV